MFVSVFFWNSKCALLSAIYNFCFDCYPCKMSTVEEMLTALLVALCTKGPPSEIVDFFWKDKSLVQQFSSWPRRSERRKKCPQSERFGIGCKARSGCPSSCCCWRWWWKRNHPYPINGLRKIFNMAYATTWAVLHEVLQYRSHKLQIRQLLTMLQKSKHFYGKTGGKGILEKGAMDSLKS